MGFGEWTCVCCSLGAGSCRCWFRWSPVRSRERGQRKQCDSEKWGQRKGQTEFWGTQPDTKFVRIKIPYLKNTVALGVYYKLIEKVGPRNGKRKTQRKPTVHDPERKGWHLTPGLAPPASHAPIQAATELALWRCQHFSIRLNSAISCTYSPIL